VPEIAEPLVGLVIASHSAKIAEGVVDLAGQMAGSEVRLIAAGGAIDGSLGTDATRIAEAIAQADSGAGVVVLADLGSAVLSAKMALDMVPPETAARTKLSGGPLVEGAVVAAVQASIGDSLSAVLEAAEDAAQMAKDVS
jgi:phosphoenolpyruvate---glycerone phosphotransferase subunit DhaM